MRERHAVLVAFVAIAVLLASTLTDAEAKRDDASLFVAEWASGSAAGTDGVTLLSASSPSTKTAKTPSTATSSQRRRYHAETSLVSHWLDSVGRSSSSSSNSSSCGKGKGGKGESKSHDDDAHKPLLPLVTRDYLGLAAAAVAILLAAGGGIGGGGLLVPIFLLVFGFGTRDSVALSNLSILGGAIVSLLFNLPRRHPRHADRPLIDWDIILVMEPSTICGAVAGGYLNKITPTWITTTLLALLLTAMAYKLVKRSRSVWKIEGEERRLAWQAAEEGQERIQGLSALLREDGDAATAAVEEPLLLGDTLASAPSLPSLVSLADEEAALAGRPKPHSRRRAGGKEGSTNGASPGSSLPKPALAAGAAAAAAAAEGAAATGDDNDEERASPSGSPAAAGGELAAPSPFSEHRLAPPHKVGLIFALTLFVLVADLSKQLVACGSWRYWLVVGSVIPPSLTVALAARTRLVAEHALRESGAPGWPAYEPGEVVWTRSNSISFPAISTLAGVVAGFFGVGGGIVKGPLMLEMGVAPEVAAATSITMILFTSSAASVLYLSFGVPLDYAKAVFVTGAIFTALGQSLVTRLVRKLGRASIIIITMATMMAISASVVFFEAGELTKRAVESGGLGRHGHIC